MRRFVGCRGKLEKGIVLALIENMQSLQFKTHIGLDGILKVQMPPEVKDLELEVLVVFQPSPEVPAKVASRANWRSQLAQARAQHGEQVFSDSVELLREDRNR